MTWKSMLDTSVSCDSISLYRQAKPASFIKNLLRSTFLTKSKNLITSRPRQLLELHGDMKPQYIVSITGLALDSQFQICKDICGEEADHIFNFIRHHSQIGFYCCVPANCILVMHAMSSIRRIQTSGNLFFSFFS